MSYLDDKIKILEMICADLIPWEACEADTQTIVLDEGDFQNEGFSFNSAIMILKDIFTSTSINKLNFTNEEYGKRAVCLTVASDLETYTKALKYPETQYFDDYDYLNMETSKPLKTRIVIDYKKGIYKVDKPELCYKIQNPSARFNIVINLFSEEKIPVSKLSEIAKHKSLSLTIKEIKKINDCFKKALSLGVGNDLIISINTGGYSLNREKFDITFN